jgi:hypothetical protein
MTNITNQLNHLIALALIDNNFSTKERNMIVSLAKANRIPEVEIMDLMDKSLKKRKQSDIVVPQMHVPDMTSEEKFEYLYNIVQLMKVDSEVFLSEIRFCEDLAVKLGYSRKVISVLSQKIFSDPSITSDREKLQSEVAKYTNK